MGNFKKDFAFILKKTNGKKKNSTSFFTCDHGTRRNHPGSCFRSLWNRQSRMEGNGACG
jgi:hypothetical protein